MEIERAECGCPKVYPLPDYVKFGAEVICHNKYELSLPNQLKEELALMSDIPVEEFKIIVTKDTKSKITNLDDRYVTTEFNTPDQVFEGPWFSEQLRGDFAWYWCGTAEDAISQMLGFPSCQD
ncbi:hypothetical protein LCGC14_0533480 [marine sediment metagenome]|uniref:Uncharacterized protein n=1 Tax=marine sediment metagenome TaxID=412755 RepID=A0A0F9V363_9ZZZZ